MKVDNITQSVTLKFEYSKEYSKEISSLRNQALDWNLHKFDQLVDVIHGYLNLECVK